MPILDWSDKQKAVHIAKKSPYRLLVEKPEYSYSSDSVCDNEGTSFNHQNTENIIIQGDNLDALKSLLPFYAGSVKCVFIDPPYNTQKAFTHYDDGLEHSIWLNMMYPRLELLHEMLAEDGSIWITIDDREAHYLKVMCDEIFGRGNFVANIVWNHRKSVQSDIVISLSHNHLLVYAKSKDKVALNRLQLVDADKYSNPDNDPRGLWYATPFDAPNIRPNLTYPITNPNTGEEYLPPKGRCWRTTQDEYLKALADNRIVFGKTGKSKPQMKRFLSEAESKGSSVKTWWDDAGTATEGTKELQKMDFDFDTPKPERLLEKVLQIATNPNDLVLDSFAGSGTTAAVAHKMNRRYIGIDIGDHAKTHIVPRLKQVIDGEQGGVSKSVGWNGGGSFRFYELGENIFDRYGDINSQVSFDGLAAYIWFHITRRPLSVSDGLKSGTPLVGIYEDTAYYLLYNGILGDRRPQGGNVLTRKVLSELPDLDRFVSNGLKIVVYGEACRLGSSTLDQKRITFKQIPYHVTDK
ncbi:site-specific DNA-methyltransferase [Neisseria sp. HMSC061B04]|uniref:site-specific DNA-methyltransferase n=1 Tax=Neisseria sp. HMSC061B04 TaxID=1715140 RepID=UPI0008AA3C4A|nr:site-specific DNA-methyltransferase [Neisseria sp. HMSC061B04]OHP52399.1 DNA methylase N-4 [Neisseria sp. HMSC061B04]